MNNDWIYAGAFLTPASINILKEEFIQYIPSDWKIYMHHTTIVFNEKNDSIKAWYDWCKEHDGEIFTLELIDLGISDKAIAVGVKGVPSKNSHPHITLAVGNGGKPFDSNKIINWEKIDKKIKLNAKIGFFKRQF